MPQFIITETVPCIQVLTYVIEAENETDALEYVVGGKAEAVDSTIEEHDYEQVQYEIEDEDGMMYDVEVNRNETDTLVVVREDDEDNNSDPRTYNEAPYGQDDDDE